MCLTIRPLPGANCLSSLQARHFWIALTRTLFYVICSHQSCNLKARNVLHYPPPSRCPCFSLLQVMLFQNTPTNSAHQNFILGHLLTAGLRSGASKWARLYAPFQELADSISFK